MSNLYHPWSVSLEEAKQIQQRFSEKVIPKDDFEKIKRVAGVGIAFSKAQDEVFVGCVSFKLPLLKIRETAVERKN